MFRDIACIEIRLIGITALGAKNTDLDFRQSQCEDPSEVDCQEHLTNHVMKQMKNYPDLHGGERELVLFISGLNKAGNLAGLAYKSRACDERLSKIWIKGLSRVALFHEIGHLLGANRVRGGIMRSNVAIADGIRFSNRSYHEINHVVEEDSRSWCVR